MFACREYKQGLKVMVKVMVRYGGEEKEFFFMAGQGGTGTPPEG